LVIEEVEAAHASAAECVAKAVPYTLNPSPVTPSPKPGARTLKPETLNPKNLYVK